MRIVASSALILVGLLISNIAYSENLDAQACRVVVKPDKHRVIDRRTVFEFAKQQGSLLICPFSEGQPLTFIDAWCSPAAINKLGKGIAEKFDRNDFFIEALRCTPLLSISLVNYKLSDPVVSYLAVNNSEKFDPLSPLDPERLKTDDTFDRSLRQFLNDTGAPVVYYNGMSNVICLSVREGEKFSLVDAIRDFEFQLPANYSVELSNLSCPHWVKERFNASLSEPRWENP